MTWEELDEFAAKAEPYAAGIGLTGAAIGMGTAMTGVGAPVGAVIGTTSQIPSAIIDLYQAGRDWYKVGTQEDKPYGSAVWNTTEAALDLAGAKWFKYLSGMNADRLIAQEMKGRIADAVAKRQGQTIMLRKKGMSDKEIAKYLGEKAANVVTNSKDMHDYDKDQKSQADKKGEKINFYVGIVPNTIDILGSDQVLPELKWDPKTYTWHYRIGGTLKTD